MTSIAHNSVAKLAAVVVGLAIAFSFAVPAHAALTASQVQSILSLLQSFGADQSTINNVNASLTGQPTTPTTPTTPSACSFTKDLTLGSKGTDVTCLQNALIANGFSIPAGATGFFGAQTQAAVAAWQKSAGVSPAAGYFGPKSRAAFGSVSTGPTTPTTPVPTGTGLAVSAGVQPANSLAPAGATRVPFTRFVVTAGNDGDVVLNSVVVQRTGLGSNASFAGVILIDEASGTQLGTAKTFNSNDQATIGQKVTIPRGTSKTFLVGGNMASSLASYAGEAPSISVVSLNTSATVTGSLPISGATHTTNNTLTVGSLSIASSNAFAANATTTKEIGTTGYRATGLRLTSSSAEDVRIRSIRWNQIGSVTGSDIANVTTYVNGVAYPAIMSADGKYYESSLGSGVVLASGNNAEVYVTYDIVGGSGRTIIFHVEKSTDIYATGETYGYGATVTGGSAGTPFFFGYQITVSGATITTIQKANSVAAQNIAANVSNQVLGGFETNIKGEALTVQSMVFTVATTGVWTGSPEITNITLVDENGTVKAGPVDATTVAGGGQTLTFSDSITIPTGLHTWRLLGKLPSGAANGGTVIVTTVPSTGWGTPKGETTGDTISLSANGSFAMNTMTIKSGAMAVTRATSPASQIVVAGSTNLLMANLQFDASQSGEDVRFSSVPLSLTAASTTLGSLGQINNCLVYDGATAISDSAVNPSGASTATYTVTATLTNPITVTKGTVKTLGIRCNISTSATTNAGFIWDHGDITTFSFSGLSSGTSLQSSQVTAPTDTAVVVTVGAGAVTVATGAGSPSYKLAAAGSTDVTSGVIKLTATNEDVNLTELGLQLTTYASSSIADLVKASIYNGATKVGEAYFTTDSGSAAASTATSTLTGVTLTTGADVNLTVKLDFSSIATGGSATSSGHFVAVDFVSGKGTGVGSGGTYNLGAANGSTAVAGIRVFKSFPTVATGSGLSTTGLADGRLGRFTVTADSHGPVNLAEFNLQFATSSITQLSAVNIYGFTNSDYTGPISNLTGTGAVNYRGQTLTGPTSTNAALWTSSATNFEFSVTDSTGASTTIQVPAGTTYYFEIRGTVTGVTTGSSVVTTLRGDTYAPFTASGRYANPLVSYTNSTAIDTVGEAAFIWSPNSTTTAVLGSQDWTNAYNIPGLPSNGLIFNRGI